MSENLIGLIGGTGLGDALAKNIEEAKFHEVDTPFGQPSGSIMVGKVNERKIAFVNRHGDGHRIPPGEVPFAANIFALKQLGVRTIIATGAVGSLRSEIKPGHLVLADQFIDKTFRRQHTFFAGYGAVHCEMAEPTCGRLRKALAAAAEHAEVKTHPKGTYACIEGPQFSTRAESLMHRQWGADLVGMTAMPEAKLAREAQMCYALIALVSDYDCWRPHKEEADRQTLLKEIIANLQTATNNCLRLLKSVFASERVLSSDECGCRKSLALAVWTDEKQISEARKQQLSILFE